MVWDDHWFYSCPFNNSKHNYDRSSDKLLEIYNYRSAIVDCCSLHRSIYITEYPCLLLAKLRYVETITESAPQLCLQVYIMLRQWDFPTYTVVSSVLSLLSLAWSITTLEKEKKIKEGDYKLSAAFVFLIWQLSTLVSRLSAIVFFCLRVSILRVIFLAAHWMLLSVTMLIIQTSKHYCKDSLILSCLIAYPSLFHSSKTVLRIPTVSRKVEMITGYIVIMLENIVMVTLSLTIEIPGLPHMDILKPVVIVCIIGGSVISISFYNIAFVYSEC